MTHVANSGAENLEQVPKGVLAVLTSLTLLLGVAVVSWWVLGSYFGVDVFASISFVGPDGWCVVPDESIGNHCFGDYAAIRFENIFQPLAGPEAVYPVSARFPRVIPWLVQVIATYRTGLIVYIALSALAMLAPIAWTVRCFSWNTRIQILILAGVVTVPFITVIDRGQVLAFAIALIFVFAYSIHREAYWVAALTIVPVAAIKPQFALLAVVLIALRQWRPFVLALIGTLFVITAPFLIYGSDALQAFKQWLAVSNSWASSVPMSLTWPPNLSFSSTTRRAFDLFTSQISNLSGGWHSHEELSAVSDAPFIRLAQLFTVICVLILVVRGKRIDVLYLVAAAAALASFSLNVSYVYYSAIAVPVFMLMIVRTSRVAGSFGLSSKWLGSTLSIAIVASLTPIIIPISEVTPGKPVANLIPLIATSAWMLFLILLMFAALRRQAPANPMEVQINKPLRTAESA